MFGRLDNLSVRFRLSAAIVILCVVALVISAISLLTLRNAENWLETIHRETLAEVSSALELSRGAANLATAAPFLLTVQLPFQLQVEADQIVQTIADLEAMAGNDASLALPLARMRAAISNLVRVSSPQSTLQADITRIDRDLVRLQSRFTRQANSGDGSLAERLARAQLMQLTSAAQSVARANALIEVGEFSRQFTNGRKAVTLPDTVAAGLAEIDAVLASGSAHLFVLKHQALTAALDAENALFRIRQLSDQVTSYAAQKVEDAEERLRLARTQTTQNLAIAQQAVTILALFSAVVAILSALFVSRYVAVNLRLIADGMHRLAAGDHKSDLIRNTQSQDEIGQLFDAFGVFRDNAQKLERRTAEIRRQNTLFANVFRNIKDGVAILSQAGTIEAENGKVRELLRLPDTAATQGMSMQDRIAQSAFSRQTDGVDRAGFDEYVDAAGHVLEIRQSQLPDGRSVWLLSETTERKRIDERLEEIRRVETLGKVTGEVAHDFGNILSTISGNLHLLETASASAAPAHLNRIRTAVDLGVSLTERLVAFARKQHLEPEVIEIGALVEGMVDLLSIALPEEISLTLDLSPAPVSVRLDPGQLESAILNLCVNAGQAISGAGHIAIAVYQEGDQQVILSISDDGAGMTPETKRRASEPFYSARPNGDGTGLGLSMVYGFVAQSGGSMQIESELGAGTQIILRFPIHQSASAELPRFSGRALVVDDTANAAVSVAATLAGLGFDTLTATQFGQGRDLIENTPDLALILTDLNLDHGQSGVELIAQTLELHPGSLAILMSSRLPETVPFQAQYPGRVAMLAKPIVGDQLADAVTALEQADKDSLGAE